jgi:hypothetical protein
MRKHVKKKLEKIQGKAKDKRGEQQQQELDAAELIRDREEKNERRKVDQDLRDLDRAL